MQITKAFLLCAAAMFLLLCSQPNAGPVDETVETETDAPDATELHITSVRRLYSEALKLAPKKTEFECDEEPFAGEIQSRTKDGKLVWLRYSGGYEHGSESYEALIANDEVIFGMKEEATWNFDIDHPPGDDGTSYTLEKAVQDRYYFLDGEVIRALRKQAEARSFKRETLDKKLDEAPNMAHPSPEGLPLLATINRLQRAIEEKDLQSLYCGL